MCVCMCVSLLYIEIAIILHCLGFHLSKELLRSLKNRGIQAKEFCSELLIELGYELLCSLPGQEKATSLGYRWIPNLPLAGLDWMLVKRQANFWKPGQTEAVAPHNSDCYYCWKEKTQQFLRGTQNLG